MRAKTPTRDAAFDAIEDGLRLGGIPQTAAGTACIVLGILKRAGFVVRRTPRPEPTDAELFVGCVERVCTCHDRHAWTYPGSYPNGCSQCGCQRAPQGGTK